MSVLCSRFFARDHLTPVLSEPFFFVEAKPGEEIVNAQDRQRRTLGNDHPPDIAPNDRAEPDVEKLLERYEWLTGKVIADGWNEATVLPQLTDVARISTQGKMAKASPGGRYNIYSGTCDACAKAGVGVQVEVPN